MINSKEGKRGKYFKYQHFKVDAMTPIFIIRQNDEYNKLRIIAVKGFYLIDRVKEIIHEHAPLKDDRAKAKPLFF